MEEDNTYKYKGKTYKMDDLDLLIKAQINNLPRWCKGLPGDFESHEWIHTYGRFVYYGSQIGIAHVPSSEPTRMYPYYICKHCHAVSNNFTTSSIIKRVR